MLYPALPTAKLHLYLGDPGLAGLSLRGLQAPQTRSARHLRHFGPLTGPPCAIYDMLARTLKLHVASGMWPGATFTGTLAPIITTSIITSTIISGSITVADDMVASTATDIVVDILRWLLLSLLL